MGQIHIVTDSTCDLTDEEIKRHGIHIVPLSVQINGKTYKDRIDLQPDTFMDLMRSAEELPKSSQPAPGVFKEIYDELGKDGSQIISIHMTGGMSGTAQSAHQASEMTDSDVTVIDSRYIAFGLAFQLREVIRLRDAGATVEEILSSVEKVRENTRLFVVLDTLDNMVKGGRIGKGKAVVSSLLNIKPIGHLDIGEVTICAKPRSHKQVIKFLMGEFEKDTAGKTVKSIGISHANSIETLVNPLIEQIKATGYEKEIEVAYTSPVISTHTGEGAIGFMYYAE
ncbi:fatty acid-binding protein DegV [Solibacillus sp. R5-41]|uniref:DegV family protein n=1 Tax=Solibacillus sp. R5-41 TaxID=2048654 RepID=UPI000C128290|nr:DegV family protein [Solibacillus sp. R5-41]ATP40096.1 fatty acid-binding protein DegV [Solibacillus sp. R5-41]